VSGGSVSEWRISGGSVRERMSSECVEDQWRVSEQVENQ
jgi:hypothetical protein